MVVANRHLPFPHPPPIARPYVSPKVKTFVSLPHSPEAVIPTMTSRKLQVVTPVPSDIDIANSVEPLYISEIAKDLNLSPLHYDLYGKYKAKVFPFLPVERFLDSDIIIKLLCSVRFCCLHLMSFKTEKTATM